MPIPKRKKKEDINKYRSRLIEFFIKEGRPQKQAVAIAYSLAKRKKGNK